MKFLVLLGALFISSAQTQEIDLSNREQPFSSDTPKKINDTSLYDNDEFIISKEEKGCRIIVFHEKSGTGFVDKSLCEKGE